nr:capsule assembly Wzi family protein [Psychrobacter aestuarii]
MMSLYASAQNLHMNDMQLKSQLDWLNSQGVIHISTSTWPLTTNEINRALASATTATPQQAQMLQKVQSVLAKEKNGLVKANVNAYIQSDRQQLPQTFADDHLAGQQLSGGVGISEEDWEFNIQANVKNDNLVDDDSDVSLEGTYLAGKAANQWLIAGKIPAWWGPGHDGSLIRGDASLPVAGLTMQRDTQEAPKSPYLSWVGPWQYQLFAGQLDDYEAVPDAKLFGMRLTASPQPWLELGASRTFMWGGDGRPESASSFFDALTGLRDNGDTGKEDPANQIGGFDARVDLAPLVNVPAGVYGQYVGEDEAGGLPAKNMYLAGADYSGMAYGMPYQVYAEYTDTRSSGEARGVSYDHATYEDGYYQQGYPLGHALGGDAESVAVGSKVWLNEDNFVRAKLQYAKVNQSPRADKGINNVYPEEDTLKVMDVEWTHQLQPKTKLSTRLWAVDSDIQSTDIGAGVGLEWQSY